jgi:hypothetical protein
LSCPLPTATEGRGFAKPFDELDPIGREEFMTIIHSALKAADAADERSNAD